jgi:hypothetical protein
MPYLASAPPQACPECGQPLQYTNSGSPGGFYRPGDTFRTDVSLHFYGCEPCDTRYMLTAAGNLLRVGPPPGRIAPERFEDRP